MTGSELYRLYEDANREDNCDVDPWDGMEEIDRQMWGRFAEKVGSASKPSGSQS